jgi:hypothetical protein
MVTERSDLFVALVGTIQVEKITFVDDFNA